MRNIRKIEIFSAGCPACDRAVQTVKRIACPSCETEVLDMLDMNEPEVARRAKGLGIRRVPAIIVDGKLAACCAAGAVDEQLLRAAGIGVPLA